MTPPISKDWWLAAALSTATVPAALPVALAQTRAGTVASSGVVTAIAAGGKVTSNNDVMVVGSSIVQGQRLRTDATGVLHVLFMDQSALTLGPDAELTIDEFTFDPATRQGKIRLGLVKGTVRVVGGQISKTTGTLISTSVGSVEILGGITIVNYTPPLPTFSSNPPPAVNFNVPGLSSAFIFGQQMRVSPDSNGASTPNDVVVTRSGFGSTIAGAGQAPSAATRVPVNQISDLLNRLETQPTAGNQGTPNPPPAGGGNLISTGNTPGGANSPGSGLSQDRLKSVIDSVTNTNPSNTLQSLLGSTLLKPPAHVQS